MLDQYFAPQGSLTSSQADVFHADEPPYEVSDGAIIAEVQRVFPLRLDPGTVYMVVLPPGHVAVYRDNGGRSCENFCAYHQSFNDWYTGKDIKYGVIPYACEACRAIVQANGIAASDAGVAEVVIIHEAREAFTDPVYLHSWYDSRGFEADDKCAPAVSTTNVFTVRTPSGPTDIGTYSPGHTFWFQKEWSNRDHGCVQ